MWRDDRAVATTEGDIAEVLEAETLVDMQKLRELSTHGIPNNLRAEAWKYLLGVARPEKDEEMSLHRQNIEEYRELEEAWQVDAQSELTRKIKAELKRHRPELSFFRDARTRQRLERLLRAFLHGSAAVEFRPGLVHLLGPLVHVYAKNEEVEAFFCFQELMGRLLREKLLTFEGCKRTSVTFMTLFRHTLPDLLLLRGGAVRRRPLALELAPVPAGARAAAALRAAAVGHVLFARRRRAAAGAPRLRLPRDPRGVRRGDHGAR